MKKAVIRNLIVILALVVFAIFSDFIYMHYIIKYRIEAFIALIIFALVCGISLALMDLSNKLINAALAILYLLFSILASAFRIFCLWTNNVFVCSNVWVFASFSIKRRWLRKKWICVRLENKGGSSTREKGR